MGPHPGSVEEDGLFFENFSVDNLEKFFFSLSGDLILCISTSSIQNSGSWTGELGWIMDQPPKNNFISY